MAKGFVSPKCLEIERCEGQSDELFLSRFRRSLTEEEIEKYFGI